MTEKQRTLERDFSFFEKAPCHLKVLPLCAGRDGARYQGWVVKKKKKGVDWGRGGGGVNSTWGELDEENINRACGVEAACHSLLQEKD